MEPGPGGQRAEARVHEHLRRHHYLGLRVVGENLKYLVQSAAGQDLACLLFGAAAWQSTARDRFIGWSAAQRVKGLGLVINNARFLILPWVKVPGLASHILSRAVQRLRPDWQGKYGHPVWLVETFVDRERFAGTAYRAANWQRIGPTQGRGRQGPDPRVLCPPDQTTSYVFSRVIQRKRDARPAGDGFPVRDFDDLIEFLTGRVSPDSPHFDAAWTAGVQPGTCSAFLRRLYAQGPRLGHLIGGGVAPFELRKSITVVDIHCLHDAAQRFVVGALVTDLRGEARLGP